MRNGYGKYLFSSGVQIHAPFDVFKLQFNSVGEGKLYTYMYVPVSECASVCFISCIYSTLEFESKRTNFGTLEVYSYLLTCILLKNHDTHSGIYSLSFLDYLCSLKRMLSIYILVFPRISLCVLGADLLML